MSCGGYTTSYTFPMYSVLSRLFCTEERPSEGLEEGTYLSRRRGSGQRCMHAIPLSHFTTFVPSVAYIDLPDHLKYLLSCASPSCAPKGPAQPYRACTPSLRAESYYATPFLSVCRRSQCEQLMRLMPAHGQPLAASRSCTSGATASVRQLQRGHHALQTRDFAESAPVHGTSTR